MSISRYLELYIQSDALPKRNMAFITGPRQVGKSTLVKTLLQHPLNYFLYDEESFRRAWAKSPREAIANRDVGEPKLYLYDILRIPPEMAGFSVAATNQGLWKRGTAIFCRRWL